MKKAVLGCFLALWSVVAFAGRIDVGAPFVAGDAGQAALSADQLQQLSLWLKQHRTGWNGLLTEQSNEPIQLSIHLEGAQDRATGLVVVLRRDGSHYLRLYGPGQWAYRSFGGLVKYRVASRELTADELAALDKILGV